MDKLGTINTTILCLFFVFCFFFELNAIEVKTEQGIVRGFKQKSRNGTEYNTFLGIFYADVPHRFSPPQPAKSWKGVRNATEPPPMCIQESVLGSPILGVENCLCLNIHTPANARTKSALLPVMMWIHGGSFIEGWSGEYNATYILDHPVVLVTINYRLGPMGFLTSGDHNLPGNNGMKDQVAAMKWIRDNIIDFGGDPNQVTIFGESAGAISVHMQMYSPLSCGLFHRAISQSSTALSMLGQTTPCLARQRFLAFGLLAGCSDRSIPEVVDCLKKLPAAELIQIYRKFYVWNTQPQVIFAIVTEPENVKDAFLTKSPWRHHELTQVPWIVGLNSGEGAAVTALLLSNGGVLISELNANYERYFPLLFVYEYFLNTEDVDKTSKNLKYYFFKDEDISSKTNKSLTNMVSYAYFGDTFVAVQRRTNTTGKSGKSPYSLYSGNFGDVAVQRHTNTNVTNQTYVYLNDHKSGQSALNLLGDNFGDLGVEHTRDLFSFFPIPLDLQNFTSADLKVSQRWIGYWVHFAYTGYPTADNFWKPSTSEEIDYLHIQTEGDTMEKGLLQDWESYWKHSLAHPLNTYDEKERKYCNNCIC